MQNGHFDWFDETKNIDCCYILSSSGKCEIDEKKCKMLTSAKNKTTILECLLKKEKLNKVNSSVYLRV